MILRFPLRPEAISPSPVPEITRPKHRNPDRFRWLALFAATAVFLVFVGRFFVPGKGFTSLIIFGDVHAGRLLAEVDPRTTYFTPQSGGYDSQWYAQLAIEPNLQDPRLPAAIDNLPYRARRILFSWTAYALGFGQPRWVLEAFVAQNILCWLLLGWLLLRWLPPSNWENVVRWVCVMFSFGLTFSVRGTLVDGPGLLLIAAGVALLEKGRPWLAALLLGVCGLGKETCILSGAALAEPQNRNSLRAWTKVAFRGLLVAAPLLIWTAYIIHLFGAGGTDSGARNFAPPLVEFWNKIVASIRELRASPQAFPYAIAGVFTVISLGTQFLFLALRPRWREAWWRVGAAFALLMMVLGESVWEGYPSAAARVLLPMLVAFNILLPRGRRWWIVLVLGNLTIISTPNFAQLPPSTDKAPPASPVSLHHREPAETTRTATASQPELITPAAPH